MTSSAAPATDGPLQLGIHMHSHAGKHCVELGCGAGLVGVCLRRAGAQPVLLTDGNEAALANCSRNLKQNGADAVSTALLDWESPCSLRPDVVLAADVLYDPGAALLGQSEPSVESCNGLMLCHGAGSIHSLTQLLQQLLQTATAYIAATVRNAETVDIFLALCAEHWLQVTDISHELKCWFLNVKRPAHDCDVKLFRLSQAQGGSDEHARVS